MRAKYIGVKVDILGHKWQVRFYSKKRFLKCKDIVEGDLARTISHKKRIILSTFKHSMLETLTHELTHAYIYQLGWQSGNLDFDSSEELFCELMANWGQELLLSAREAYNDYLQLKEKMK